MVNYRRSLVSQERQIGCKMVPKREIGSKTGSFDCVQVIKEVGSVLFRVERGR